MKKRRRTYYSRLYGNHDKVCGQRLSHDRSNRLKADFRKNTRDRYYGAEYMCKQCLQYELNDIEKRLVYQHWNKREYRWMITQGRRALARCPEPKLRVDEVRKLFEGRT